MAYMLIMRATEESQAAAKDVPFEDVINAMGVYNEALMDAGVLAGGDGLSDPNEGAVVEFTGDAPTIRLGAYGGVSERFSGYWVLNVASLDEATMWAARCPMVPGSSLEVRRITDESDFAEFEGNQYLEKEKTWREMLQGDSQ